MSAVRAACLALATLVLTSPALAAPAAAPSAADREAARSLAKRGYELFQNKDYAHAIESFSKAESMIHAPPHWLYIARSQVKLGKLRAAKATYEQILAEKLPDGSPPPFREAQVSAKSELSEVDVLIPSVELTLTGPGAAKALVEIDGEPFPRSALEHPYPADPGLHNLVVTVPGDDPIERAFSVKADGATEHVTIDVAAARSKAPIVVAFTVGGLGLAAGGTTLGLYLTHSPKSPGLEAASVISFVAGGLGVGAGIALLSQRSSSSSAAPPKAAAGLRLEATVGVGSIGLGGSF